MTEPLNSENAPCANCGHQRGHHKDRSGKCYVGSCNPRWEGCCRGFVETAPPQPQPEAACVKCGHNCVPSDSPFCMHGATVDVDGCGCRCTFPAPVEDCLTGNNTIPTGTKKTLAIGLETERYPKGWVVRDAKGEPSYLSEFQRSVINAYEAVLARSTKVEAAAVTEGKSMNNKTVLQEVTRERIRQELKWGGPEHDDTHSRADWINLIDERLAYQEEADDCVDYRKDMIEIAALAIAAVESLDRKAINP